MVDPIRKLFSDRWLVLVRVLGYGNFGVTDVGNFHENEAQHHPAVATTYTREV